VRGWEVNILEDARHGIGLSQYHLSTITSFTTKAYDVNFVSSCGL
jgi:hypothetical protein